MWKIFAAVLIGEDPSPLTIGGLAATFLAIVGAIVRNQIKASDKDRDLLTQAQRDVASTLRGSVKALERRVDKAERERDEANDGWERERKERELDRVRYQAQIERLTFRRGHGDPTD